MQVNILEAKSQLSQLIRHAQAGEEVFIANRGKPVARLVPVSVSEPHQAVNARNFLRWLADNPVPAYAQRSADEIDSTIEDARSAWD